MKKVLLVLTVSAVLVLLFATAALAQKYGGGMKASPQQALVPWLVLLQALVLLQQLVQQLVQPLRPQRCPQPAEHRWWGHLPGWPP
jgi:ABC-type transport system involved in cytochrome bd biosynthesis fused ATPase/permease subunit